MTALFTFRPQGAVPRSTLARRLRLALCLALLASLAMSGEALAGPIVNFSAPTTTSIPQNPSSVASGDFNQDGDLDLVVASDANSSISILLGGLAGTFSAPTTIPVANGSGNVAVGDFDQNGDPDLAVVGSSGTVTTFVGAPGGATFDEFQSLTAGSFPVDITIGDLNADGEQDLVVANQGGDNISIFTGADGARFIPTPINVAVGDAPGSAVIGNFNGDADLDIAVTNHGQLSAPAADTVTILTGTSGATIAYTATTVTVGDWPDDIAAGDFNQDGDTDLAVVNSGSGTGGPFTVSILTGGAGSAFTVSSTLTGGSSTIAVADFNSDGDPDLATAGSFSNDLAIFVGTTGATFRPVQTFPSGGQGIESLAVGDWNVDGRPDTATARYSAPGSVSTVVNTSDLVPPDTTIQTGPPVPPGATNDTTPSFTFTSNEAGATFECNLNNTGFATCPASYTTPTLSNGSNTLVVRAVDAGGNVDGTPASRTFTVDTVAPDTTIQTGPPVPPGATNDTTPSFTFASNEAGATFECNLNNTGFATCPASYTTPTLSNGSNTVVVRAVDAAGNVDGTPASRTFTVDTVAPDTNIATGPAQDGFTNDNTPTFTFTSPEAGVAFQCNLDNTGFATCPASFTTPQLSNASHTLAVRAVDAAGNVDGLPASRTFTVDTAVPDITINTGPTGATNDNTPTFTFSSTEPGVGFGCRVDGGSYAPCTSPYTSAALADGPRTFEVIALDLAGNMSSPASRGFTVDASPPDTNLTSGPSGLTNDKTPTFAFSSAEPGATFQCKLDNAPAFTACTSPHTTAALTEGTHTFQVQALDAQGNADPSAATRTLTVDSTPPETKIDSGPSGAVDDDTPTFVFSSTEAGARFQCKLDNSPFVACTSPLTLPKLSPGSHTFQVRSIDRAGNVDQSPSSSLGAEAALRAFTVESAAVDPPVYGRRFNAEPIKGDVFVSVPPGTARASVTAQGSITVPGIKGRNFIPLREARQVPVGSLLDTRKGTVRLQSARNKNGATQASEFVGGVFQVLQSGKTSAKGLTELRLKGASFSGCGTGKKRKKGKRASVVASRSKRRIRRLRGNGKGRFRTRGRYSSATVRGTIWTVTDRCDGTLTKVSRGRVAVRDLRKRKTKILRAGKSYLARAP